MEAEGALCASVFVGFPNADIEFAGPVGGGRDRRRSGAGAALVRRAARPGVGGAREQFVYEIEPLAESMARARALADAKPPGSGPVVLLDHSDNCASGGTMDTMTVLGAILDAGLEDVAAFAIFDPEAVQQMVAAGVGAEVTLSLGGKLDMPAIGLQGRAAHGDRRVRLHLRRPLPQPRADGARRAERHGSDARCSTPAGCRSS